MRQMRNTKLVKILIIVAIAVIVVICGIIATLYFTTDLFKSNKILFFKYVGKMIDDEATVEYFKKKENTAYNNNGKISVDVDVDNEELTKAVKDFNISFSGPIDPISNNMDQQVIFNFSKELNIPFEYRKLDNIAGVKSGYISPKFISIDMDNQGVLPEALQSIAGAISTTNVISDDVDAVSTDKQAEQIIQNYVKIILKSLNNKSFRSLNKNELADMSSVQGKDLNKGYELSITLEDINDMLIAVLTNLKDDKIAIDKINEYLGGENTFDPSVIESGIQELNDYEFTEEEKNTQLMKLTIYSGKEANILRLTAEKQSESLLTSDDDDEEKDSVDLTIAKSLSDNVSNYVASAAVTQEGVSATISLNADFEGLSTMQNVKESYSVGILSDDVSMEYSLNNDVSFIDSAQIDEFTADNNLLLNNYPEEQIETLLNYSTETISNVYELEMQKLGLEEEQYPLLYVNPIYVIMLAQFGGLDDYGVESMESQEIKTEINSLISSVKITYESNVRNNTLISNNPDELTKMKIKCINDLLLQNGDILDEYKITYNGNNYGENNLVQSLPATLEIKGILKFDIDENFNVKYTELAGGKSKKNIDPAQVAEFNSEYEIYKDSSLRGVTVKGLLSIIDSNNESDKYECKIEEINFNGEEYEATEENITFIKEDILTDLTYKVEFEKDEDSGVIYRVVINEN